MSRSPTIERIFARRELLLAGAAVGGALVSGGCSDPDDEDDAPFGSSLRFDDPALNMGFQTMYGLVSLEDRDVLLNEIIWRKDLRIHFLRLDLSKYDCRGGACVPHGKAVTDGWCSKEKHPDAQGIRNLRNWDLVYDEQREKEWEEETGIYNRVDTMLYHEIFGHILRILRAPKVMYYITRSKPLLDEFEKEARAIENRYRRHRGHPLVPEVLPRKAKR